MLQLLLSDSICTDDLARNQQVPPAINQFSKTLDKNLGVCPTGPFENTMCLTRYLAAQNLFKLLLKYRPEDKKQKKVRRLGACDSPSLLILIPSVTSLQERLLAKAEAEKDGKTVESKKPVCVKFGLDHVTYLVEQCKAQLVVIAHDVDPIELVVWLPALCRKMGVPYCIVKGKSRLGAVVHQKTATVLALTNVKNEDKLEFSKLVEAMKANFNDRYDELRKAWGGGIMGVKSQAKTRAQQKLIEKELRQRQ